MAGELLMYGLFPIVRWLHVSAVALIVGGTLFFELVVPIAIEDLKDEQQLYIMARSRWAFRWVVWIASLILTLTGVLSFLRMYPTWYTGEYQSSIYWVRGHVVIGAVGLLVALLLATGRRPLSQPVRWMRLNLVILLVAIFLGSVTREMRLSIREGLDSSVRQRQEILERMSREVLFRPATAPATQTTQP